MSLNNYKELSDCVGAIRREPVRLEQQLFSLFMKAGLGSKPLGAKICNIIGEHQQEIASKQPNKMLDAISEAIEASAGHTS